MRVGTDWWSLELEPGWSAVNDPECVTITKSNSGAFQISAGRRPERPASLEELRKAAERQHDLMGPPLPVTCGGFRGFTVSYSHNGAEWRRFWLGRGPLWIFATYN